VLFIVMAITILSLGFVSRSDVELACGQNMLMKTQIDYLAESGLEHAKGLILNPQDVAGSGYWGGGTNLQLTSGNDFYDVQIDRDSNDLCNYIIDCDSFRLEGTEKIGLSRLHAVLRIDPCIAYWVGSDTTVLPGMTINGDVYCGVTLTNNGTIDGDAFATGAINGTNTPTGRKNDSITTGYPVAWPNISSSDFSSTYYIGENNYSVDIPDDPDALVDSFPAFETNRAGILYCPDDANMPGGATINGTLVVAGDLTVSGTNNFITAEPNFPALIVDGQIIMKDNSSLVINGLAQVQGPITFDPTGINADLQVIGGLFINTGGIGGITSGSVNIIADPAIASIETWPPSGGAPKRWSPAAGAFFKSIERR